MPQIPPFIAFALCLSLVEAFSYQHKTLFKNGCHTSNSRGRNPVRLVKPAWLGLSPHPVHSLTNNSCVRTDSDASRRGRGQSPVTMGRISKEIAGQVLSFLGLVGVAVACGVPLWRVTFYIGANIVTGQIVWDGLWMNCVMQATGQMQCKLQTSILSLTPDLQAARALVIISLVFGFIGFILSVVGAKCSSCLKDDSSMAKVVILGGCFIIVCAILILIPVCWSAAVTISDYESPLTLTTQKREIGASIYIGWGTTVLLLIGGILLTTSCPPQKPLYGYPGYAPPPIYPYGAPATYAPVYAPPSNGQYSGSYAPSKQYAAPAAYTQGPYL